MSCSSAGNCAGFGVYSDTNSFAHDMVATEICSKWNGAVALIAPTGSQFEATAYGGSGDGVACTTKDSCTAGGSYGDSSGNGQAMAAAGTI